MIKHLLTFLTGLSLAQASETLHFEGKDGPGKDKHIVLVSGDEEYRSEQSLPMLGKILSQRHGFDCTVVFSWDKEGKHIDPNNQQGLRGLSALDSADLMIIATRFRRPSAEEAAHLTKYLNAGKPVIGLRTATHAFNGEGDFGGLPYGKFGLKILGEQWVNHHGKHKVEGARAIIEEENKDHPILNEVSDIFAYSDVYGVIHLTDQDRILLRAAVTETLAPDSKPLEGEKNDPAMPFAWLHPYQSPDGKTTGTSFCTTGGAAVDLKSEDLRRLIVNASYSLTGLEVPAKADVSYVDDYKPTFYGFIRDKNYWPSQDLQPADFDLGKSPQTPNPPGTPAGF
ncbi:MAG: ThuA domain-containing protein [Verrucomicrobiales bacterium]